jgi:hypothetical protein
MIREIGDAVARRDARALCLSAQALKGEVANFASSDAVDEASRSKRWDVRVTSQGRSSLSPSSKASWTSLPSRLFD